MTERRVWSTDRYGAQYDVVTLDGFRRLLAAVTIGDGDGEHSSVSLTDSDGWNLEYRPDRVLFENVEGEEVGSLHGLTGREKLEIAGLFLQGDLAGVRDRRWVQGDQSR